MDKRLRTENRVIQDDDDDDDDDDDVGEEGEILDGGNSGAESNVQVNVADKSRGGESAVGQGCASDPLTFTGEADHQHHQGASDRHSQVTSAQGQFPRIKSGGLHESAFAFLGILQPVPL